MFRGAAGGPKPSRTELDSEMNAANTLKSPRKARNTRAPVLLPATPDTVFSLSYLKRMTAMATIRLP